MVSDELIFGGCHFYLSGCDCSRDTSYNYNRKFWGKGGMLLGKFLDKDKSLS